jgi:hypothetical protein
MTDPPRGLIKPAILAVLAAVTVVLAAVGSLGSRTRPAARARNRPDGDRPRSVPT